MGGRARAAVKHDRSNGLDSRASAVFRRGSKLEARPKRERERERGGAAGAAAAGGGAEGTGEALQQQKDSNKEGDVEELEDSDEEGGGAPKQRLADLHAAIRAPRLVQTKEISVARWLPREGVAEVLLQRTRMWTSIGVTRGSRLLCNVEETLYCMERGSLVLLLGEGHAERQASVQHVYGLLLQHQHHQQQQEQRQEQQQQQRPAGGCTCEEYSAFAHLRRLGYIVGRHAVPWTTATSRRRHAHPGDRLATDASQPDAGATISERLPEMKGEAQDKEGEGMLPSSAMSAPHAQARAQSEAQSATGVDASGRETDNMCDPHVSGLPPELALAETSGGETISPEERERDGRHQNAPLAVVNTPSGASLAPQGDEGPEDPENLPRGTEMESQALSPGESAAKREAGNGHQEIDSPAATAGGAGFARLQYDVYLPNSRFRKTDPGPPLFSLCVTSGRPPTRAEVKAVQRTSGEVKVKFAAVAAGNVSLFSFDAVTLPTMPY
eukprot:jgi/Mesen1/9660/ME000671S09007